MKTLKLYPGILVMTPFKSIEKILKRASRHRSSHLTLNLKKANKHNVPKCITIPLKGGVLVIASLQLISPPFSPRWPFSTGQIIPLVCSVSSAFVHNFPRSTVRLCTFLVFFFFFFFVFSLGEAPRGVYRFFALRAAASDSVPAPKTNGHSECSVIVSVPLRGAVTLLGEGACAMRILFARSHLLAFLSSPFFLYWPSRERS